MFSILDVIAPEPAVETSSNLGLYVAIGAGVLAVAVFCIILFKKKKNNDKSSTK